MESLTAWPPMRLPHPGIRRRAYWLDTDGVLRPSSLDADDREATSKWQRWSGLRDRDAVLDAGEIYLELSELDLDNEEAILAFANRWGPLAISYGRDYRLLRELPGFNDIRPQLESVRPAKDTASRRPGLPPVPQAEALVEFQLGARCIRDLSRAWHHLQNKDAAEPAEWESFPADTTPTPSAERFLQSMLNRGLSPFHPFLQLRPLPAPTNGPVRGESPWIAGDTVPLYATCCLELYNHIVDHAAYLTCTNETCRRTFVRQTGRAEHGQYRSRGLKYCSRECARAQAQRALRARRRTQQPPPDTPTKQKQK